MQSLSKTKPLVQGASEAGPHLSIHLQPLRLLKPDPGNPRTHSDKQVRQLAKSISAFGFCVPLLVDAERNVIAGHGRLLAAQQLGWSEVPAITLEHLTPLQIQAFRVADNRLSECSTWDPRLLGQQLKTLSEAELDFDLDAIGFDLPEIDLRIQCLDEFGSDEGPDVDSPSEDLPVVTQLGDVWQLGGHRIICGNALEAETYERLMQGRKAVITFTDPPFNVKIAGNVGGKGKIQHAEFVMASGEMSRLEFTAFLDKTIQGIKTNCVPGALLYVCMDWRHLVELSTAGESQGLELKNLCVWTKNCGGMGSLYRSQHELIFVYKNGSDEAHVNNVQLGRFGRNRTNVWAYDGANSFSRKSDEGNLLAWHPTVKPVALVADAVLDASERGSIVLDAFLGSGTTIIAAEKTGRVGYGIELDPKYVDTSIRRWQRLTGGKAIHGSTGETFEERESVSLVGEGAHEGQAL
ncbi:site-specific DNA-methyltransferase [Pseudoxanthomonas sacheonensis]|uniref:site-specific DNA-methyltransferase n=1 Tax=Pseudoxanthomonas sacheonensis TaxID=443615 RepID=UPI0013D3FC9B|nr:site-specific DNA-methyltransferase [Pseudoxanthomonas sacheonensis]KAF1708657.1 DNA methylase N-4 [Pseudoxanthomonas sacheonensis]